MAYRAHVLALDLATGRPLTLSTLRHDEAARSVRLGHIGTRHGAPGIWIEIERPAEFFYASLERACRVIRAEGRQPVVHTTNIPSQMAASPLRTFGIGVHRG